MAENNSERNRDIRKKLGIHGNCGRHDPQKCKRGVFAKIEDSEVVVCTTCLTVISEECKIDNVEKIVSFSEDMLFPTSR